MLNWSASPLAVPLASAEPLPPRYIATVPDREPCKPARFSLQGAGAEISSDKKTADPPMPGVGPVGALNNAQQPFALAAPVDGPHAPLTNALSAKVIAFEARAPPDPETH